MNFLRNVTNALALAALLVSAGSAHAEMKLVANGKTDYVIVLPEAASESEKWAAQELADHLKQISGAELKVQPAKGELPEKAIVLGASNALKDFGVTIDLKALGEDAFVLKTVGSRLVIAGGAQRGTMYGVFDVLEKLGCRWWYPGASTIPSNKNVTLPDLDETQRPALEYRDMLYGDSNSSEAAQIWRARNRVNGGFYKDTAAKYGGSWKFHTLVHSYAGLMPPAKYFKDHPEYFALRNGKRTTNQPCFSQEAVVAIMADSLGKLIEANPEFRFVTVGQEDNREYCQCDACKALAEKTGSLGGMQLDFGKRVAALFWKKHPNVPVNVPAYEWSRQPPTNLAPAAKMSITLCTIECNFGQPLKEGYPAVNADFKKDIEGWSKIAPTLYIWDYTTDFDHYLLPYPNYPVLIPNIRFYADHHVKGIMHQGSHTTRHGQFAPLCMYLMARGMWNPDLDSRKLIEEFCVGYYGPKAGPFVLAYTIALETAVARERAPLWTLHKTHLSAPYLTPAVIAHGDELFRQAEMAVKDEPELLRRVQTDHIPLLYVMLKRPMDMIAPTAKKSPGLTFEQVCKEFSTYVPAARIEAIAESDGAKNLVAWAADRAGAKNAASDLPAELQKSAPGTYRLWHAAQMDTRMNGLGKMPGASDGWAQKIPEIGWSLQHRFGNTWDFTPGKRYKFFVRAKAKVSGELDGKAAVNMGIWHKTPANACSLKIAADKADGEWRTYEMTWTPAEDGGAFYIVTTGKNVTDAFVDCVWLVEIGAQGG